VMFCGEIVAVYREHRLIKSIYSYTLCGQKVFNAKAGNVRRKHCV